MGPYSYFVVAAVVVVVAVAANVVVVRCVDWNDQVTCHVASVGADQLQVACHVVPGQDQARVPWVWVQVPYLAFLHPFPAF